MWRAPAAAMAQSVQPVQELIPDSFVPCVAALCSEDAERLTRLNRLSFAELLKPFSRLTSEGACVRASVRGSLSLSLHGAGFESLGSKSGGRAGPGGGSSRGSRGVSSLEPERPH